MAQGVEQHRDTAACTSFTTGKGAAERFVVLRAPEGETFADVLANAEREYRAVLGGAGLSGAGHAFTRVYLSDIENQKAQFQASDLFHLLSSGAVSIVEQPPIGDGPLALLAYHVEAGLRPGEHILLNHDPQHWRNGCLVRGANYRMLWTVGFDGRGEFDSRRQTTHVLESLDARLADHGMTMFDNLMRTWIYVRDIDNHYRGMVEARNAFFEAHNMNPDTHYVASTGIEGRGRTVDSLLTVDALAIDGIVAEQVVRMEAPEYMSPTIKYGVTFERGTRIRFGDRSHLHVSGTASIDKEGNVLHEGDARRQAHRTLDNIEALLAPQGASLADMQHLLVYLRDPHDYRAVAEAVAERLPENVPPLFLKGAVCRPTWLVEMEGVGIVHDSTPFPAFL